MWKHSVIVSVFNTGDHSKCWSTWSTPELRLASRRNCTNARAVSDGVQRDGWLLLDVLHVLSATRTFVAFVAMGACRR